MSSTSTPVTEVTFEDIRRAAERIRPIAKRTPVLTSRSIDARAGASVFFKCENFQTGGAFKIRGASNFILSIPKEQLAKGVVSHSSGNHAQAVAIAAEVVGVPATLVMPEDAPKAKIEGTRARGAKIVSYDRFGGETREQISERIARETGATIVPPYDHPWTIAGQGTAARELLEEVPDLDALVVCVGGGGLCAGSSIAARHLRPAIRVFGIEPELANDTYLSFAAGERVKIETPSTIADGLRTTSPGALTFPILRRNVEAMLLVSEDEIRETVKFLMMRMKIVVEPSGAVGAAAVLFKKLPAGIERIGVIISGGNVDYQALAAL
ncbi:MAG TPA: pyridoxal-phosphate dependent enzyme [Bryobacteraceae bacterium]|jgi:threonine dehydratase|nr:pyridoxal-phosphate dependent enzyme [Bryobacteraceae bacterium]